MKSIVGSRAAAAAGVIGASLFFAGDMLFYGFIGSGAEFSRDIALIVRGKATSEIVIGGLLGPIAAWLCCIGFMHVRARLKNPAGLFGSAVVGIGTLSMVALGAVHLLWGARALAFRSCGASDRQCATLAAALKAYWNEAWGYAAIPGYALAALLAILVLAGRTHYPRWTIFANPAVTAGILALLPPLPAPVGGIVLGGGANLALILFFAVSASAARPIAHDRGDG